MVRMGTMMREQGRKSGFEVLARVLMVSGVLLMCGNSMGRAAETAGGKETLILSAPVTHSDWMLRDGVQWGADGVRHMLDMCKASGWSRVYWRALDGGRALYTSHLLDPQGQWDEDNFWNPADRKSVV